MENEEQTRIVEINGVKMEVDLRHAKVIHENLKVGSKVKLLTKTDYHGAAVYPGVVIGFENFTDLPTIIVAYTDISYSKAELKFAHINNDKKSVEKWSIIPALDDDMPIDRVTANQYFDKEEAKLQRDLQELADRRAYFDRTFDVYFKDAAAEETVDA